MPPSNHCPETAGATSYALTGSPDGVPNIFPGSAGTISTRELSLHRMGDGDGRTCVVIKDERVLRYVGIGWVPERPATQEDADLYPVAVYPEALGEHRARC